MRLMIKCVCSCCLIDHKWRYTIDNEFAAKVLSLLEISQSLDPQQDKLCCLSCDRLILSGSPRWATDSSLEHCMLCKVLNRIQTEHGQDVHASARFTRNGSYVLIGDKKVLTIRRSIGQRISLCAFTIGMAVA
jgi:phage FluMu protein Com